MGTVKEACLGCDATTILVENIPTTRLEMYVSLLRIALVLQIGSVAFALAAVVIVVSSFTIYGGCEFQDPLLLMLFSTLYLASYNFMHNDTRNMMIVESFQQLQWKGGVT